MAGFETSQMQESGENMKEALQNIANEMNEQIGKINPDVTYTLDFSQYNETGNVVIQLKNFKNNAGARLEINGEALKSANDFLLSYIQNPHLPYTDEAAAPLIENGSIENTKNKLRHVGLITE